MAKSDNELLRIIAGGDPGSQLSTPAGDLSVEPYTFTTTEEGIWKIGYIYIAFSEAVSETVTITKTTSGIDELLDTTVLSSDTTVNYVPATDITIDSNAGEQIKIDITDTGGAGTVNVVFKKIGV